MKKPELRIAKYIILLMLLATLSACGGNGLDVTAKFINTKDIEAGTTVYFQGRAVGEVIDVSGTDTGSVVKLEINQDAATGISAEAAVVVNRIKPGAPLEVHNPTGEMAQSLQPGQSIKGMDSMLELMAWSVGDAINESDKEFTSMIKGFQDYLKGDDFQRSKDDVKNQMKDVAGAAGSAMNTIKQDINEAFDEMVAAEEEMAIAIEDLGNELSPVVEEMSKTGTELALEMERFAQSLEQATPEERESGQRLMESITEMLTKLNDSMEKGAEQAQNK